MVKINNGENTRALIHHIMRIKQQRYADRAAAGSLLKNRLGSIVSNEKSSGLRMTETRIYIGLNDAETKEQKFETEKYLELLKDACRKYNLPFSVDVEEGGYYHDDGEYTEETSLVLILIDAEKSTVKQLSKEICGLFCQESVLVTENIIDGYFINKE